MKLEETLGKPFVPAVWRGELHVFFRVVELLEPFPVRPAFLVCPDDSSMPQLQVLVHSRIWRIRNEKVGALRLQLPEKSECVTSNDARTSPGSPGNRARSLSEKPLMRNIDPRICPGLNYFGSGRGKRPPETGRFSFSPTGS